MSQDAVVVLLVADAAAVAACVALLVRSRRRRAAPAVTPVPGGAVVVSPDRHRSAWWDGSSDRHGNTAVFAGPDCSGDPLFFATLVHAASPAEATQLAAQLGGHAHQRSLGDQGSTGPQADRLYYCDAPATPDADRRPPRPPRESVGRADPTAHRRSRPTHPSPPEPHRGG